MRAKWLIWGFVAITGSALLRTLMKRGIVPVRRAVRHRTRHPARMIPDSAGHYDIDGVSYDYEGVVVSSDAQTGWRSETRSWS